MYIWVNDVNNVNIMIYFPYFLRSVILGVGEKNTKCLNTRSQSPPQAQ